MRVIVAVNQVSEIGFRQTTALLIASLARKGFEVWATDVGNFSIIANGIASEFVVSAISMKSATDSDKVEAVSKANNNAKLIQLSRNDTILIRTNPGRDLERALSLIHI